MTRLEAGVHMAARERIGVGIIGAGFARSTQVPAFQACPGVEVVSLASARRERAEAVARELGIRHVSSDWRDVVRHPDVHLVSIATPPHLHREMTLAALEAGKAVLCEKPTALDASEAEAMWRAAQGRGVLALMDHELRFLPARQRLRELVRSGELGALRHARVHYRSGNRADASRPWDWWSDAGQGGGVLGALGSHAVDALRFLLGREPTEVLGALATHTPARIDPATGTAKPVTADEEAEVLLRFDGGLTATVTLSSVEPGEPMHLAEVFGVRGGLRVRGSELWRSTVGGRTWERVEVPPLEPLPRGMLEGEWSLAFVCFARALTEALRSGRTSLEGAATLEDGWRNQRVLDAARRSHAERRWVVLPV